MLCLHNACYGKRCLAGELKKILLLLGGEFLSTKRKIIKLAVMKCGNNVKLNGVYEKSQ